VASRRFGVDWPQRGRPPVVVRRESERSREGQRQWVDYLAEKETNCCTMVDFFTSGKGRCCADASGGPGLIVMV